MFGVISVNFNIRNTLPKSGTFLLGHPVYTQNRVINCDQLLDNPRVSKHFYACSALPVGKVPSLKDKS